MPASIRQLRTGWDLVPQVLDVAAVAGSLWLVTRIRGHAFGDPEATLAVVAALSYVLAGQLAGMRGQRRGLSTRSELVAIATNWVVTVLALLFLSFLTRYGERFPRSTIGLWMLLAPVSMVALSLAVRLLRRSARRHGIGTRRVAIAGYNRLGLDVAKGLLKEADGNDLKLIGFFDDRCRERLPVDDPQIPGLIGKLSDLVGASRRRELDLVLVTLPMRAESRIQSLLDQLSDSTSSVYLVPDFFVFELLHSKWGTVGGLPAVSVFESPFYGVDGTLKRMLDLVLATIALALAAGPMLIIALLVKLTSPGPVLFKQKRYGLDGEEIRIWKFRSMTVCEDGSTVRQASRGDARVTPLGVFLRKTSLDELPQLFNVLGGSMSLVGPRPHATAHNEEYRRLIRGYMLRHKVKPGVTGLAQVSGCRGETDTLDKMRRRVEFDLRYIRDWSLLLDLRILRETLWVAWRQPEAY